MTGRMLSEIEVNEHILDDEKYTYIFSVEEVNKLALSGVPFRDAYKQVGLDIEAGNFHPSKDIHHTHEGSIGNLCNGEICILMQSVLDKIDFSKMEKAESCLLA
jgi:argininosuccinate lyase